MWRSLDSEPEAYLHLMILSPLPNLHLFLPHHESPRLHLEIASNTLDVEAALNGSQALVLALLPQSSASRSIYRPHLRIAYKGDALAGVSSSADDAVLLAAADGVAWTCRRRILGDGGGDEDGEDCDGEFHFG